MNKHPFKGMALSLAVAAALTGCTKSPEGVIEAFYRAVAGGQTDEARGYLSRQIVDMLGDNKLSAGLASESAKIKKCGGIRAVTSQLQGEGQERHGTTTVTYDGDCPARTENTRLVQENGDWKITIAK